MDIQSILLKKFGSPSVNGYPYLTSIQVPFPMEISWKKGMYVNSFTCNYLIKNNLSSVFQSILKEYGSKKIVELGINIYGGCFNYRKIGNSDKWSMHAWGLAIDLDPERNSYNQTSLTAQFAKKEYEKMIDKFMIMGLFP